MRTFNLCFCKASTRVIGRFAAVERRSEESEVNFATLIISHKPIRTLISQLVPLSFVAFAENSSLLLHLWEELGLVRGRFGWIALEGHVPQQKHLWGGARKLWDYFPTHVGRARPLPWHTQAVLFGVREKLISFLVKSLFLFHGGGNQCGCCDNGMPVSEAQFLPSLP